jgi:hypothetical protein
MQRAESCPAARNMRVLRLFRPIWSDAMKPVYFILPLSAFALQRCTAFISRPASKIQARYGSVWHDVGQHRNLYRTDDSYR